MKVREHISLRRARSADTGEDVQRGEVFACWSMRLPAHRESDCGANLYAVRLLDQRARRRLLASVYLAPLLLKVRVVRRAVPICGFLRS